MVYAKDFFDLQLHFADAVVALSGRPLADVLLDYTNLYIRFGLGHGFDRAQPIWQDYLAGLTATGDTGAWTYDFYGKRSGVATVPGLVATSGCFAYARLDEARIRLHFENTEPDGHALAAGRAARRRAELAALLAPVPPHLRVVGASWLYNLEAYRRLFPPPYLATARALAGRFRHMPLWGQFLGHDGTVRDAPATELRQRLRRQTSLEGLEQCFPLPVLSLEAPVRDFHDFYVGAR